MAHLLMESIGHVMRQGDTIWLQIYPELAEGLLGLEEFSHIWVLYWFHQSDTSAGRKVLQVHPRRDPAIPLHGVFATRSPLRPNLVGMSICRVLCIEETRIQVEGLDAQSGSPLVDIKPYIPQSDSVPEARVPAWIHRPWPGRTPEQPG